MSHPCPKCAVKAKCVNSRQKPDETVHRRFNCQACGCRFSSVEVIISVDGTAASPQLNENPKSNSKRLMAVVAQQMMPSHDPVELMQALLNEISRVRQ